MIELWFDLEQDEDDWPPVGVEGLWCEPVNAYFRLETCPLFVKGLSVGDLITVETNDEGRVQRFTVAEQSANSTVWMIFWDGGVIAPTLKDLRELGCDTTGPLVRMEAKICSVNVPASVDFAEIDAILEPLERSQSVAVAHPSHRHPDC